jgi:hypothetical protein
VSCRPGPAAAARLRRFLGAKELRSRGRGPAVAASFLAFSICLPQRALAQGGPIGGTASVTASPSPSATSVGSPVLVAVRVGLAGLTGKSPSGSSTQVVLGAYQIAVGFDRTRLRLDSVAGGTSAGYTSAPTFTTLATANAKGSVTLVASQVSPTAPTGVVTVALLSFTTLASGTAPLGASLMSPSALSSALQPGPPPVGPTAIPGTGVATSITISGRAPTPTLGPALQFYSLVPCRVVDTRKLALGASALAGGATRAFSAAGSCGIPATAKALAVNVTVTLPTARGDLRLFPAGSPLPVASVISYGAGQTRAANTVIGLGTTGAFNVYCDQASGTTQFVLDVNGYFQ